MSSVVRPRAVARGKKGLAARPRAPAGATRAPAARGSGDKAARDAPTAPAQATETKDPRAATRSTRQRSAIRHVIAQADRPLLPTEILVEAQRTVPALGIATVYRNLKLMVDDGELCVVTLPGVTPRFELAESDEHVHLLCRRCSRVFDIYGCPGDFSRILPEGFRVDDYELTLYGVCPACAPPRRRVSGKEE